MTPQTLYENLMSGDNHVVLRRGTPEIAHLSQWMLGAFDNRGELTVTSVVPSDGNATDRLEFSGKATICNSAVSVTVAFSMTGGEVVGFYLIGTLADTWQLSSSFRNLKSFDKPGEFLARLRYVNPCFVLAANAGPITSGHHGINNEVFENGLNVYASGLLDNLPVQDMGFNQFRSTWPITVDRPNEVKAHLEVAQKAISVSMQVWWPKNSDIDDKIMGATVVRPGWFIDACALGSDYPWISAAWLWELRSSPDEPPYVMMSQLHETPGEPITYTSVFPTARFLQGGASGLGAFTDGSDPSASLPFDKRGHVPELSLAALTITPGKFYTCQLVAMDGATGKPFAWEAVKGLLTVRDVNLSLSAVLGNSTDFEVGVVGTADIEGYDFLVAVNIDPKGKQKVKSVSGILQGPHEVDVQKLVEHLFEHPVELPNLQLKLLNASYENDYSIDRMAMSLDVGGHIDLFGNGLFLLTNVGFSYTAIRDGVTDKELHGGIELAGLPISMKATYEHGDGWTFEGEANPYQAIHIDELLHDLLNRVGLTIPPVVPDIAISELGASFKNNQSKQFRFWGRATWQPPNDIGLPWHLDEIDTVVDVTSAINATTAARETTIELQWLYSPSDDFTFTATAEFGPDNRVFYIDWDGTADGKTIGFNTIHDVLNLGDVFTLPGFKGWSIFEFSMLTLRYQSNPRMIETQTTSKLGAGTLTLSMDFEPNNRVITGSWTADSETGTLGIDDLLAAMGLPTGMSLPGSIGADVFSFHSLSLQNVKGLHESINITGQAVDSFYKDVFVSLYRGAMGWGFVAGVAFKDHAQLTDIPGIGELPGIDALQGLLSIEPAFLLFSTVEIKNFVPPIAGVHARAITGPTPAAQGAMASTVMQKAAVGQNYHLSGGATFAGRIIMEGSDNSIFALANEIIGIKELDATITVGKGIEVMAAIPGELEIPVGGGDHLAFRDPYLGAGVGDSGTPTLSVGGNVTFEFFGEHREISAALYIGPETAAASFHLTNFPLPPLHALPGVQFKDDFYVEMAIQFEPPGFDMGFEGSFYIGDDPEKNTGDATVVMNLSEGIPTPLYIRCSIEKLTFFTMFEAMTGTMARLNDLEHGIELAEGSDHPDGTLETLKQQYKNLQVIFDQVSLNNVAFHWADTSVILPDGTTAMPGVGFKGMLDLFGFDLYGAFDFSTGASTHFSAHLEMEPIRLQHVIAITGDGKGLRHSEIATVKETKTKKTTAEKAKADAYVLNPGGPVFIVSSQHAPYLHANIHFELFDTLHLDLTADVDQKAMTFKVSTGVGHLVTLDLTCQLSYDGPPSFCAHGRFEVSIKADFSIDLPVVPDIPISLDCGFSADVSLKVTDGEFTMSFDGHIEFEGAELSVPTLTLHESFPRLEDLPEKLIDHIKDNATHIFSDLIGNLKNVAKLAEQAVDAGIDLAEKRVDMVTNTAEKAVDAATQGVEAGLHAAEHEVEEVTNTLKGGVTAAKQELDKDLDALENETNKAVDKFTNESRAALSSAEDTFNSMTGGAFDKIPGLRLLADTILGEGIHAAGEIAKLALKAVHEIADAALTACKYILDAASTAAKAVYQAAKAIFDGLGVAVHWVGNAVKDAAGAVAEAGKWVIDKLNPGNWC